MAAHPPAEAFVEEKGVGDEVGIVGPKVQVGARVYWLSREDVVVEPPILIAAIAPPQTHADLRTKTR